VASYKASTPEEHDTAAIVVFHGNPKPWDIVAPWVPTLLPYRRRESGLLHIARTVGATTFVEVGCKEARTSAHLLRHLPNLMVWAIDLFEDAPVNPAESYADWNYAEIRAQAKANLAPYADRAQLLVQDSCAPLPFTGSPPIGADLVFVDAAHDEASVERDIRAWTARLTEHGILAGHDINWPTVRSVVERLCPGYHVGPDNTWYIPASLIPPGLRNAQPTPEEFPTLSP